MILQRLCEAASHFSFPPFGYQEGTVRWLVDLDGQGHLLGFIPTTEGNTKGRDSGKRMPHPFVKRTSGVEAQLLADRASYALGLADADADERARERAAECHRAFAACVQHCYTKTLYPPLAAVLQFLDEGLADAQLPDDLAPGDVVTFQVDGELLIHARPVREHWANVTAATRSERSSERGRCLVCGGYKAIADRMPVSVKPIPGGQTSGCAVVSANASAFESYGREASLISPICWDCAQRHAEVLNAMLNDPGYSYRLQDRLTYVFWTRKKTGFSATSLLSQPDPQDVRRLLESVHHPGGDTVEDAEQFYSLAVSGSGGRVVIRDWFETTLGAVKRNLARYFEAQDIASGDPDQDKPLGLYTLMGALIPSKGRNPWKQLPPNLATYVINTALSGTPLPDTLLHQAVMRARTEHSDPNRPYADVMTRPRAAVIKMCLLLSTHREEGFDVTPELNPQIQDPAFLCGRLLATLENIQSAAVPGAKATLVDRYYGTASSAPASVFPSLMRLAQSHLGKLRKEMPGAHTRLQQAMEDIAGAIGAEFPRTLSLTDQGKFALGYYQQRAADHAAAREAAAAKKAKKADQDANNETREGDNDE